MVTTNLRYSAQLAADKLHMLMKRHDALRNSQALRWFIEDHWKEISFYAHVIHDQMDENQNPGMWP